MSERKPSYGKKRDPRKQLALHDLGFTWGPLNWALLGAGVAAIVVGFFTLAKGSMTLAPVCLVVGFCVLVPASLLARAKTRPSGE
jgi:uncharacterized membrane protein HdeD (DUF308 family)